MAPFRAGTSTTPPPSSPGVPLAMNVFVPYLAALHQHDLLEEATMLRLARRAQLADGGVPAWCRFLAVGAQRLSAAFASAARTIDPAIDCVDAAAA